VIFNLIQLRCKLNHAFQNLRQNDSALWYVGAQLTAKAMAAAAQLYAIYVFTKVLSPNEAALIFILLGYGIWVQVFEFGLSQVIQNALNSKKINFFGACRIISLHYLMMVFLAAAIGLFPEVLDAFQGRERESQEGLHAVAFPLGIALLLVSTNAVLVQRLLLVINLGVVASNIVLLQSTFGILVLMFFQWRGSTLIQSVAIYMLIPILVYLPLVLKLARKAWWSKGKLMLPWPWVMRNALGFWGLTAMGSLYLGADYFFASRYLTNEEMISYHFASRLFFISYVAYFSYVQFMAKGISVAMRFEEPFEIWKVAKKAVIIGLFSVVLVLLGAIFIDGSGMLNTIGSPKLLSMPFVFSASLYYGIRVLRDVGLVLVWNMGRQRMLYVVHAVEVILCFSMIKVMAAELGGVGIFIGMAMVAALSATLIYIALRQSLPRQSE